MEEKWIDFEDEIRRFLLLVYDNQQRVKGDKVTYSREDDEDVIAFYDTYNCLNKNYGYVYTKIKDHLDKLLKGFEIYLDVYINNCEIIPKAYFNNKKIDHVLSFNYTVTYTERYNADVDCCYIHGRANLKSKKNNMVLGFDNQFFKTEDIVPELIPFEKFYQRVVMRTDNQYLDWLEEIEYTGIHNVYIYGHSLGVTDGDVLKKFLLAKNAKVHIYYYDEKDRAEKIKNMVLVIGADNVIKYTGGKNPKIVFETDER